MTSGYIYQQELGLNLKKCRIFGMNFPHHSPFSNPGGWLSPLRISIVCISRKMFLFRHELVYADTPQRIRTL